MRAWTSLLLALAACGSSREAPRPLPADPAAASAEVRALIDGCPGYARALARIAATPLPPRVRIGLVDDAVEAARPTCALLAPRGTTVADRLARARLAEDRPADALAALGTGADPALRYRRAELLDRLGRVDDAVRELDAALAVAADEPGHALHRLLAVARAARAGAHADAVAVIARAPIADRPGLAHRAAADAPLDALAALATAALDGAPPDAPPAALDGAPPDAPPAAIDVALAAADRLEEQRGPAAVLALRERIATATPDDADAWDALGRARIAAGRPAAAALAAWDRAIALAPAQPSYRLAPITALQLAEQPAAARARATTLAAEARARGDVALLVTASSGALAAGDPALALALADDARTRRPGDGRLAFLVAQRLADAGQVAAAAAAHAELLACGAHGRPWHRHEVAGKLLALGEASSASAAVVLDALAAPRACAPVAPADLAPYVDGLRAQLAPRP